MSSTQKIQSGETFVVGGHVGVKCMASRSVLAHEVGVTIRGKDRSYESLVDEELVQAEELGADDMPACIGATIVEVNGTNLLIELPRQVVAGGRRIWIPKTEAM